VQSSWRRIPYLDRPDFSRPILDVPVEAANRIFKRFARLYGEKIAWVNMPEVVRLLRVHHAHKTDELIEFQSFVDVANRFNEQDMILITYGDLIQSEKLSPLVALANFLEMLRRRVAVFNTLHILPFFPYSSDRGFSITDYRQVNPRLGSWRDIDEIGKSYKLMFDGVFNHASSQSEAFQQMLCGNPDYWDFAIVFHSEDDLTPEQRAILRRPRTSDVLTKYYSIDGPVWVWTTFSSDQIDLNFRNPRVLLTIIDTLLHYVRRGANMVRIDAATYMWHQPGTPSASLEETHEIIKIFREVLDIADPGVALVTETNVPHAENISYFGNGYDEAQMVYNFALPPLVLHAFYRGDATWLSNWAANLEYPTSSTTYLNMLDTHDGIGLLGASGILPKEEIDFLVERAQQNGALISYRSVDGGVEPYEINTTWYSALNPSSSPEDREFQVKRFTASRAVALVLRGVPGIYLHGLVGSRNDVDGALDSGVKRDINRATLDEGYLRAQIRQPGSRLSLINRHLGRLLELRIQRKSFHPNGAQKVLMLDPRAFVLLRSAPDNSEHILSVINVSDQTFELSIPEGELGVKDKQWYGIFVGRGFEVRNGYLKLELIPYDIRWLSPLCELGIKDTVDFA
jgi:sucrose phosphorylase